MRLTPSKRKRWANRLTLATVAGMAALLLVFVADPYKPGLLPMSEQMWAMSRRWQFYLLMGVIGGGAAASIAAWRWGRTGLRLTLIGLWVGFVVLLVNYHAPRVSVMAKLIFRHVGP